MQNAPYKNTPNPPPAYMHDFDDFEESEINLRDYLKIIKNRWVLIASVMAVIVLATIVATYTTTPSYTASSQVLVERNRGKSSLESNAYYYEPDFLETQAVIITSENVALKVVRKLQLATRYKRYFIVDDPEGFAPLKLIRKNINSLAKSIASLGAGSKKEESPQTPDSIDFEPKSDEQIIAEIIRGGLSVTPVKNTKILNISYMDKDPAIARLVADEVVKAYMDEMLEIKLSTSSYSLKWMTEKANEERDKLERSERELQRFMRENDLVTVENKLTILPQKLSDFGSQLSKAQTEKNELQDLIDQVKLAGNDIDRLEKIPQFAKDGVLKDIRERIYKANQNVQELSKKYGPKHPIMIRANDELRILREEREFEIERIVSSIENSYALAASKEENLKELLGTTKGDMLDLNERFMQYSMMKRSVDSNRVLYETLQTSIKEQGVTEQSQTVNIWVIKKAEFPLAPTKPNKKRNLMLGLILGLFSGVGLAFFIEYLDNTVKNGRQVEEQFGLTVLGAIEELKKKGQNIDTHVRDNLLSPLAESYRLIRTALLLSTADHPPKVVLVTSMNKEEGKTVTVANLARMLAKDSKNVLIIDCDLRRPRMHTMFTLPNDKGLSVYLAGNTDECTVLKVPEEEFSLIPAGPIPPDPAELLGSSRMQTLLSEMTERFDFILIDSPPYGAVTDSLTLSRFADGTVLVIKAGSTTVEAVESGVKRMRDINARILGVVLNRVKKQQQDSYQYGYGYGGYYGREDD